MTPPSVPVSSVVLVIGAILLACCAAWSVVVQQVVPDICQAPAVVQDGAGPIRCEK